MPGEDGGPLRRVCGAQDGPLDERLVAVAEATLQPVDVADEDLEEVVELVRDAVGQQAQRLALAREEQRPFGVPARVMSMTCTRRRSVPVTADTKTCAQ